MAQREEAANRLVIPANAGIQCDEARGWQLTTVVKVPSVVAGRMPAFAGMGDARLRCLGCVGGGNAGA